MKRGKKYVEAAKLVDRTATYSAEEAVALVKKASTAKFDETVEAHIRTGCDGRHAEQQIRGAVVLPHGTGKTVRVLVFAKGAKATEAEAADWKYPAGFLLPSASPVRLPFYSPCCLYPSEPHAHEDIPLPDENMCHVRFLLRRSAYKPPFLFLGLPVLSCISEVFTFLFSLPGHLVIISHPHASRSRTHQHCILLLRQDLLKVKPNLGFYEIVPGQKMLLLLS